MSHKVSSMSLTLAAMKSQKARLGSGCSSLSRSSSSLRCFSALVASNLSTASDCCAGLTTRLLLEVELLELGGGEASELRLAGVCDGPAPASFLSKALDGRVTETSAAWSESESTS